MTEDFRSMYGSRVNGCRRLAAPHQEGTRCEALPRIVVGA
jgi:hypothetical protein